VLVAVYYWTTNFGFEGPKRLPCPHCGATGRQYALEVHSETRILQRLDAEGRRAGMSRSKGWFKRIRVALVGQRNRAGPLHIMSGLWTEAQISTLRR
jgi:hypothetical protein